jgi:hypothetical protein
MLIIMGHLYARDFAIISIISMVTSKAFFAGVVWVDFEVYNRMAIPKRYICKRKGLSYGHHERTRMGLQISRTVDRTTLRG